MFRYLQGLIDLFGKFDQDQDGVVEFNEFGDLWTHLGGEPPIVGAAAAAVKGEQLDAARSKEFSKFDRRSWQQRQICKASVMEQGTVSAKKCKAPQNSQLLLKQPSGERAVEGISP